MLKIAACRPWYVIGHEPMQYTSIHRIQHDLDMAFQLSRLRSKCLGANPDAVQGVYIFIISDSGLHIAFLTAYWLNKCEESSQTCLYALMCKQCIFCLLQWYIVFHFVQVIKSPFNLFSISVLKINILHYRPCQFYSSQCLGFALENIPCITFFL